MSNYLQTYLRALYERYSQEELQRESPLFRDHWNKIKEFILVPKD